MEIGATKAVQDRLKTIQIEESKGASLVFCWDTHLTKIKGRNVLFIVNTSNRYTIAMTDIIYGWSKVLELIETGKYEQVFGKSSEEIYDEWVLYLNNYYQ